MATALAFGASGERRSAPRILVERLGTMRLPGALNSREVVITDLTRDGCGLSCDLPVAAGTCIEIGIANVGRVQGTIVRSGLRHGCMFDQPLPSGAVTAALGPSNVVSLDFDTASFPNTPPAKLSPRARLGVLAGAVAGCWLLIAAATLSMM